MNTKFVYVLVSDDSDYYYEMLRLSVFSLLRFHPDANIELVMDEDTYSRLRNRNASVLSDVNPITVSIPPEYSRMQRSRYIKTNLRSYVRGRFAFLDCDTIICDRLDGLDHINEDIAFAYHNHGNLIDNRVVAEVGFPLPKGRHMINYNSGFFLTDDTPKAATFFDIWFTRWKESASRGFNQDQPALFQTIIELGYPLKEIDGGSKWNCQILSFSARRYLKTALIYHYYGNAKSFFRDLFWEHIREYDRMDELISRVVNNPRTIAYEMLSVTDDRLRNASAFGVLFMYEKNPVFFRFLSAAAKLMAGPTRVFSKLIHLESFGHN